MPKQRIETGTVWRAHQLQQLAVEVWNEMFRTRAFVVAAALSFYFLLSLVPLLIVFSSLLAFLPIPNVFDQLLDLMATVVPPEAMALVQKIMIGVLTPHSGGVLSFGVLGYLWSSSGGYSAIIEALDISYGVEVSRPWWKDRLQALFLTVTTGALLSLSLLLLVAGPGFVRILAVVFPVPVIILHVWPGIRLVLTFTTVVAALLVMYVFGPNTKITFRSALPGAILAVFGWIAGSTGLTFYLQHFGDYNVAYGSLGAVIVLMLWFYLTATVMLLGAQVNAQLAKHKLAGAAMVGELPQALPAVPAV